MTATSSHHTFVAGAGNCSKGILPLGAKAGHRVAAVARMKGLIIRPIENVVVLLPPLSVTPKELRRMVTILRDSIATLPEA